MKKINVNNSYKAVVIGGSAGSFQGVVKILSQLPKGFPLPIIMALHRLKHVRNGFVEALSIKSVVQVTEPNDKETIKKGSVYLAPANYHMLVERGGQNIALSTEPPVRYARPSIDVLFESVAASVGTRAIAVVLTGASDDGAQGALSIKRAGGRVIVQTPASAESPVAPSATLAKLQPDALVDIDGIADVLRRWLC